MKAQIVSARNGAGQVGENAPTSVASRLLSTAAHLFWERGYTATSTRELSDMLGVQKATLYHHVRKKEDLLYAICVNALKNMLSRVRAEVDGATTPTDRVRLLIHGHL